MRVKQGFVMREVAGVGVVIATGEASKAFHGMIKLNDTGQLIWRGLEEDLSVDEIVRRMASTYDVDPETARADVEEFLAKAREANLLDE